MVGVSALYAAGSLALGGTAVPGPRSSIWSRATESTRSASSCSVADVVDAEGTRVREGGSR